MALKQKSLENVYRGDLQYYYTGENVDVFFDNFYVDECTMIGYRSVVNNAPIYAYNTELFNSIMPGNFRVEGKFAVNFVSTGYVEYILQKGEVARNNKEYNPMGQVTPQLTEKGLYTSAEASTGNLNSSNLDFLNAALYDPRSSKVTDQELAVIRRKLRDFIWGYIKAGDEAEIQSLRDSMRGRYFDITMMIGNPNTEDYDVKNIVDAQIIDVSIEVVQNQPIGLVYTFIARDVDRPTSIKNPFAFVQQERSGIQSLNMDPSTFLDYLVTLTQNYTDINIIDAHLMRRAQFEAGELDFMGLYTLLNTNINADIGKSIPVLKPVSFKDDPTFKLYNNASDQYKDRTRVLELHSPASMCFGNRIDNLNMQELYKPASVQFEEVSFAGMTVPRPTATEINTTLKYTDTKPPSAEKANFDSILALPDIFDKSKLFSGGSVYAKLSADDKVLVDNNKIIPLIPGTSSDVANLCIDNSRSAALQMSAEELPIYNSELLIKEIDEKFNSFHPINSLVREDKLDTPKGMKISLYEHKDVVVDVGPKSYFEKLDTFNIKSKLDRKTVIREHKALPIVKQTSISVVTDDIINDYKNNIVELNKKSQDILMKLINLSNDKRISLQLDNSTDITSFLSYYYEYGLKNSLRYNDGNIQVFGEYIEYNKNQNDTGAIPELSANAINQTDYSLFIYNTTINIIYQNDSTNILNSIYKVKNALNIELGNENITLKEYSDKLLKDANDVYNAEQSFLNNAYNNANLKDILEYSFGTPNTKIDPSTIVNNPSSPSTTTNLFDYYLSQLKMIYELSKSIKFPTPITREVVDNKFKYDISKQLYNELNHTQGAVKSNQASPMDELIGVIKIGKITGYEQTGNLVSSEELNLILAKTDRIIEIESITISNSVNTTKYSISQQQDGNKKIFVFADKNGVNDSECNVYIVLYLPKQLSGFNPVNRATEIVSINNIVDGINIFQSLSPNPSCFIDITTKSYVNNFNVANDKFKDEIKFGNQSVKLDTTLDIITGTALTYSNDFISYSNENIIHLAAIALTRCNTYFNMVKMGKTINYVSSLIIPEYNFSPSVNIVEEEGTLSDITSTMNWNHHYANFVPLSPTHSQIDGTVGFIGQYIKNKGYAGFLLEPAISLNEEFTIAANTGLADTYEITDAMCIKGLEIDAYLKLLNTLAIFNYRNGYFEKIDGEPTNAINRDLFQFQVHPERSYTFNKLIKKSVRNNYDFLTGKEFEEGKNIIDLGNTFINLLHNKKYDETTDINTMVPYFIPNLLNDDIKSGLVNSIVENNDLMLPRINSTFAISKLTEFNYKYLDNNLAITSSANDVNVYNGDYNKGIILDISQIDEENNDLTKCDAYFTWLLLEKSKVSENNNWLDFYYTKYNTPYIGMYERTSLTTAATFKKFYCTKSFGFFSGLKLDLQEAYIPLKMIESKGSTYHTCGDNNIIHASLIYDKERVVSESIDGPASKPVTDNPYAINSDYIGETKTASPHSRKPIYRNIIWKYKGAREGLNKYSVPHIISTTKLIAHYGTNAIGFLNEKSLYKYLMNSELYSIDNSSDKSVIFNGIVSTENNSFLKSLDGKYRCIRINLHTYPTLLISLFGNSSTDKLSRNSRYLQYCGFKDNASETKPMYYYGKKLSATEISNINQINNTNLIDQFLPITMIAAQELTYKNPEQTDPNVFTTDDISPQVPNRSLILFDNYKYDFTIDDEKTKSYDLYFMVVKKNTSTNSDILPKEIILKGSKINLDPKNTLVFKDRINMELILKKLVEAEFKVNDYYFTFQVDIKYIYSSINSTLPTEIAKLNSSETQIKLAIAQVIADRISTRIKSCYPFSTQLSEKELLEKKKIVERFDRDNKVSYRIKNRKIKKMQVENTMNNKEANEFALDYLYATQNNFKENAPGAFKADSYKFMDVKEGLLTSNLAAADEWDVTIDDMTTGDVVTFIVRRKKTTT